MGSSTLLSMAARAGTTHPLAAVDRPEFERGSTALQVVDLFAGCGGLTLGIAQAAAAHGIALDVPLAVDFEDVATEVYRTNFPKAHVETASVEHFFDGELGSKPTATERDLLDRLPAISALVGGPPCQGHSDLNNHTRRNDPKNSLYARMARAAEILRPSIVMVENVPAVRRDKSDVVGTTRSKLLGLGYQVGERLVRLDRLGVAQRRKRHILLATIAPLPHPDEVFSTLETEEHARDLKWAIGDLQNVRAVGIDAPARASTTNAHRMQWLLDNDEYDLPNYLRPVCHQGDHSYTAMYGRLRWDQPAQTITSGFGSLGQGRFMHPALPRTLTPHEAARIQGFPDYFDFTAVRKRAALGTMIGNAVPPQLGFAVFNALVPHLDLTG